MIDHRLDYDYFYIKLAEGQVITVEVDSVMIDPFLSIDLAGDYIHVEDDDGAGGLLGQNSGLTVKAIWEDTYLIIVHQSQYSLGGGYILSVSEPLPEAIATALQISAMPVSSSEDTPPEPAELDPETIGTWEYFSVRPKGWVEDTAFFRSAFGNYGANV